MAHQIDRIDEELAGWVTERVSAPVVSFDPPGAESDASGVSLYLLELVDDPVARTLPMRTREPAPLQVLLRYLVSTWASDPGTAHRLLGELAFAAMESARFRITFEPAPAALWLNLQTPPRPSFFLSVPLRRERARPDVQRVLQPLVVETAQLRPLAGRVVGPGNFPIAGASVELPALNTRTETDPHGQFQFGAVPHQDRPERLVVRARGTTVETEVDLSSPSEVPLTIQIESFSSDG